MDFDKGFIKKWRVKMKCAITSLMLILIVSSATAQVPRTVTYQGILKDSGGNVVTDSTYSVTFRIFNSESGGSSLWDETIPCTTSVGLFGSILNNVNLSFAEDYWLELEVDSNILSPRQKLNMSAYAARADTADFAFAITQDAIEGGNIIDSSVFASDLGDESGVAQNYGNSTIPLPDTTPGELVVIAQCDIACPTSGYVMAIGRAYATINHTVGIDDNQFLLCLSESSNTITDHRTEMQWTFSQILPTGTYTNTVVTSNIFNVTPGNHQFFLLAYEGSNGPTDITVHLGLLSLNFFPTAYGIVD